MAFEKIAYFVASIFLFLHASVGDNISLTRKDFPSNFFFGVASAAYQYEGGYLDDGKGLSNWDVFSHSPGNIDDGSNADVTVNEFHRYKEHVEIMSEMGVEIYRFSIAWSRIYPEGNGEINPKGVHYYTDLIDELLSKGMHLPPSFALKSVYFLACITEYAVKRTFIEIISVIGIHPFVTLSHYDIPQALEDQYRSWLNPRIADDFARYADTCFRFFGDRVKYWTTFNEPNVFIYKGYDTGDYPPSRCSVPFGNCSAGNSSTEPYIAAHNVLRAHASAVDVYRKKYQADQGGFIGIVIATPWFEPLRDVPQDLEAAHRILAFKNAWYLDPIVWGEYPEIMRKLVGKRLPAITEDLRVKLRGSFDFIGMNYYSSYYATDASNSLNSPNRDYDRDSLAAITTVKDGVPIGDEMYPPPLVSVPYGIEKMVHYLKTRYSNPPLFVTENGFGNKRDDSFPLLQQLNDTFRVNYIENTLKYLAKSIRDGADVRGYFVWSLLDNFEWNFGYTSMFGMYHVDFRGGQQRHPKLSAHWYRNFLKGECGDQQEECLRKFWDKHDSKMNPTIAEV